MAALPVQGNLKQTQGPRSPREATSPSPESSLSWCLSHLYKPGPTTEMDKRSRTAQWRALVAIRTQHIKGGETGIARFRIRGGLQPLVNLLKDPDCSRKALDLALSILANCCTELETRVEVRKLDGIVVVVDILKRNVAMETVQNRAARALGNLAMDPENSTLIHSAGGVPLLLHCVSLVSTSSSPTAVPTKAPPCPKMECAQSAARALLYLSDTPSNRLSLLTHGTLSALAPLVAPEYPHGLRRAALRTLHELTRGCGAECAREVSRSGALAQLGAMASGESGKPFEELALKTLANVCSQGCLRPLVGSLGAIPKFTEEVERDPLRSGVIFKALCLCCKEAVNRAKVKESGGLEALISFLAANQKHPLSRLAVLACVDFVYDESAMEQLQELGLVPLLVARLVELTKGEEPSTEKMEVSLSSNMSPMELLPSSCFDSFDFPPPEGNKKEEGSKEQGLGSSSFLSLRSWLVSEGLITSEGDLESPSGAEGEWVQVPPSSSPQTSSPVPQEPLPSHTPSSPSSSTQAGLPHLEFSSPSPQLSPAAKNPSPSSSTPQPCSSSTPQLQLGSPSALFSPTKAPQAPNSTSKFSSPQRKRPRIHPPSRSARVSIDAPPSVPRPLAYHHPFHPEPWAPESPLLLLLSRFSHATDPSAALVTPAVISGLIFYLTQHRDPSSRCFRMLCRLSCNPNCLQALVRTGTVALIHHHLCQTDGLPERGERQSSCVKAKVKQLGLALLNNLRVQCESGFGAGVLAHVMLTGTESDKMNCALSLPLIHSNKALLKKLLLDNGGLLLALEPLDCTEEDGENGHSTKCVALHSDWLNSPHLVPASQLHSLYFSLLIGCLCSLMVGVKTTNKICLSPQGIQSADDNSGGSPPPLKKPRLANCSYGDSTFDLLFLLDDGTKLSANREAVAGSAGAGEAGSEYFRALLKGGFCEAQGTAAAAVAAAAIPIKDVGSGMLLPVLHYLHGCRLLKEDAEEQDGEAGVGGRRRCQVLESLAVKGFGVRMDSEERLTEMSAFQNSPLGEAMIGACRFLVSELKREVEELCISLLVTCSTAAVGQASSTSPREIVGRSQDFPDGESADESLAKRTSGLELSGSEGQTENPNDPVCNCKPPTPSGGVGKANEPLRTTLNPKMIANVSPTSKQGPPLLSVESRPKISTKSSTQLLKPAEFMENSEKSSSSSKTGSRVWSLGVLLPEIYWFSQRYSYPDLGRACLSLLLTCGGPQPILPSSSAGVRLQQLARGADCTETLKRDVLTVATLALS